MPSKNVRFKETTVNGSRTRLWALDAVDCPELGGLRIARVGMDFANAPYERVRSRPAGSFFLASLEGEGSVWLEGRWQRIPAGALCMAPPRVLNAFHALKGKRWTFAWVRYDEPNQIRPLVGADSPLWLPDAANALGRAISGLREEWEGARDPALCHHWVQLIHGLAGRYARPWRTSSRVSEMWQAVAQDLAYDWKLATLASQCHMSAEHLRRLCIKELGRSPMEHVTYMRVQKARDLLESSEEKLEVIARSVGYHSATVFSRAFMRCAGMTPSSYRARR